MYEKQKHTLEIIKKALRENRMRANCGICKKEFILNSYNQKYCKECGDKEYREMQLRSAKRCYAKNPEKFRERSKQGGKSRRVLSNIVGEGISENNRFSILDKVKPKLVWKIIFEIPFTYALSKNALLGRSSQSRFYIRPEARKAQNEIIMILTNSLRKNNIKIAHNKLWIKFLVEKPNIKGDAINVIDTICDAIVKATGLDDRWYCIRGLDWTIVKKDPHIFVEIGQETNEDVGACSYCGRLLSKEFFCKSKYQKLGFGRECKDCRKGKRLEERIHE